jgi:dipeptidase E
MQTLLLTSTGMNIKEEILKILPCPANQINVAYITTASKSESDKTYVEKDRKLMEEAGFTVEEIDIEGKNHKQLFSLLQNFGLIFVQGGNTFHLLKAVKESGFDKVVKDLIARGVIYVGVSAGSIICGPNIEVAGWKNVDRNIVGLKDLTALNLIDFNIFVHYLPKWRSTIRHEQARTDIPIRILTDKQGFLIKNNKIKLVGAQPEIVL